MFNHQYSNYLFKIHSHIEKSMYCSSKVYNSTEPNQRSKITRKPYLLKDYDAWLVIKLYSKLIKTQHLYFRYLSNMDLSIKILFSLDDCTFHILSRDYSLCWLIVHMRCLKVLVRKQVIWFRVAFRMSDLYPNVVLS